MIAIVLGSGFTRLVDHFAIKRKISFDTFVDFKIYDLEGHERIIYEAIFKNIACIIVSGKLHSYEGYNYLECTSPFQFICEKYQITDWIITSASGALNQNCAIGKWQKISSILSLDSLKKVNTCERDKNIITNNSKTYAFQKGPSLGTVAEYVMLSRYKADLVGMSMLPEAIFLNSINANYYLYSLPVCSYASLDYTITEPKHTQVLEIANKGILDLLDIIKKHIK